MCYSLNGCAWAAVYKVQDTLTESNKVEILVKNNIGQLKILIQGD